jgi:hypothetical protein
VGVLVFVVAYLMVLQIGVMLGWRWGKERGQRLEVQTMIELLDALKIDSYEQVVFRDRFKGALQWALDGKRKKDRNG